MAIHMKKISLSIVTILIFILLIFIGCSKVQYTNFQDVYIKIVEEKNNRVFDKNYLEELVGTEVTEMGKGDKSKNDLNSYKFIANDEELLFLTDSNSDELVLIKYEKYSDIKLVYSLKEGTDIGGYKPGFTSEFLSKDFEVQRYQINEYLK